MIIKITDEAREYILKKDTEVTVGFRKIGGG